jgi:SMODS-associating 4TM effector domain
VKFLARNSQHMDNIGKHILETQNESFHIDKLLAQKNIYSKAKILQGILIFITIPLPIIIALILKFYPTLFDEKHWFFVLYLVLASLFEKVLENYVDRYKKLAASIQEAFDTKVLNIEENESLNTANIDNELIRENSKEPRKNSKRVADVTNWYSLNIISIRTNIASILCQRTNIFYDFSVRKRYNWAMRIIVVLTFIILMVISLKNNITLKLFLIEVVIPSIPVFMFAYKEINSNTESIDNLEHLRNLIEVNLNNLTIESNIQKPLLRKIQDRIYSNRILNPLIPDFLYYLIRPKLEDQMNYSVEQKVKELTP